MENGDIVLRRADEPEETLVTIQFGPELAKHLGDLKFDLAKVMVQEAAAAYADIMQATLAETDEQVSQPPGYSLANPRQSHHSATLTTTLSLPLDSATTRGMTGLLFCSLTPALTANHPNSNPFQREVLPAKVNINRLKIFVFRQQPQAAVIAAGCQPFYR